MLEELAKNNELWYKMALSICDDKDYAKDLVQEMYLKLYEKQSVKPYYVYYTIKSIYIDSIKESSQKNRYFLVDDFTNFENEIELYNLEKDKDLQDKIDIINEVLTDDIIENIIVTNSILDGLRKFSRDSQISIRTVQKYRTNFKEKVWQRKKD